MHIHLCMRIIRVTPVGIRIIVGFSINISLVRHKDEGMPRRLLVCIIDVESKRLENVGLHTQLI